MNGTVHMQVISGIAAADSEIAVIGVVTIANQVPVLVISSGVNKPNPVCSCGQTALCGDVAFQIRIVISAGKIQGGCTINPQIGTVLFVKCHTHISVEGAAAVIGDAIAEPEGGIVCDRIAADADVAV